MKLRPGPGWQHWPRDGVWDHRTGICISTAGLILIPDQAGTRLIWENKWPHRQSAERWIKIAGGNRKRGLMLWALDEYQKLNTQEQPQ
jgi:hypothetical protein